MLHWVTGDEMPAPLCQPQHSGSAGLQRHLPSRPRVWSKDEQKHLSGDLAFSDPGLQHRSLGKPFPGLLQRVPEGPGVIHELRAAAGLRRCLAGPVACRPSHMCIKPCLFSALCFLLLADGATFPPGQVGYF